MKKSSLKIFSLLLCIVAAFTAVFGLSACKDKDEGIELNFLEENIVEDAYDNYYEIFVYSYCDSDGDGIGDLNGIKQKLDYIRDLGYTGIWLMPIHPASSYHGYDVTDYYSVNSKYGTIDDYKALVAAAHEKGIKVIIDLVVNHTSSNHPWFKAALAAAQGKGGDRNYLSWYTFSNQSATGYHQSGGVWYESNFDAGMPDLNLGSPKVREEIEKIIKYWIELGTDGFRLDGCKYYYPSQDDGADFCGWIKTTACKYNENAYIVGENWSGKSSIANYYKSGADSFFYFDTPGNVSDSINTNSPAELWVGMRNCYNTAGGYVPAPFLSNHDNGVGRIAGRVGRDEEKVKFAYGLLSMYTGSTFTYYGDEIGMVSKNANSDPDLRVGMLWDNDGTGLTKYPPGASKEQPYIFDGVKEQLENKNSILSYYKLCNNTRNAFPAIMRGKPVRLDSDNDDVLLVSKTYKDSTVTIAINLGDGENTVHTEGTLAQSICVTGRISKSGTDLKMPKYSIAILT